MDIQKLQTRIITPVTKDSQNLSPPLIHHYPSRALTTIDLFAHMPPVPTYRHVLHGRGLLWDVM